jgi:FkbM family methyltransferase
MFSLDQPTQWVAKWIRSNPRVSRVALACIPDIYWYFNFQELGRFRVRLRRNRSLWLRPLSTNEWYPFAALEELVRPGDIVWDVGGNIGLYARLLVSKHRAGHVYSFEPDAENVKELNFNINLGGVQDSITIIQVAISDGDGFSEFQIDDQQSASGTLNRVSGGKASPGRAAIGLPPQTKIVETRSIDSLLNSGELPPPDVMKIDVEGAESLLLQGGRKFFASRSPRLLIETHGLEVSRECLKFLFSYGYHITACVPYHASPDRHMIIDESYLCRMTDQYDAHFIIASKFLNDLPTRLRANPKGS